MKQREIKFRVWDKFQKKFLDHSCYFNSKDFNEFTAFDRYFKCDEEGCIVQQYTGLKDKNGKEIYEGDIFKFSIENREKLCIAKFGEYTAPWDEMSDKQMGFYLQQIYGEYNQTFSLGYAENVVIAGNIFENPDLLK